MRASAGGGNGSTDAPPATFATSLAEPSPQCQYHFTPGATAPLCRSLQPLDEAVKNKDVWGETPYEYVVWFDRIWRTGDPSKWGPDVFTPDSIMVDSAGSSVGGAQAASDFLLLFKYFPELRGEVVSWSANETEIQINWHFIVTRQHVVPVVDKFMFTGGKVSHRQACFDTMTFLAYLGASFGPTPLIDYFVDRFLRSTMGGGILFIPSLLWDLFVGLFRWSPVKLPPPIVRAEAGIGTVRLAWNPVQGGTSYTIKRSKVIGGPYSWIAMNLKELEFTDTLADSDTDREWYYTVSTNSAANAPPIEPPPGRKELQ